MPNAGRYLELTRLFKPVEATTEGGNNTVIAAVAEKRIVVFGYVLSTNAEANVNIKSGSTVVAKLQLAKSTPACCSGDDPVFECGEGQALVIENPASTKTYGHITYGLR